MSHARKSSKSRIIIVVLKTFFVLLVAFLLSYCAVTWIVQPVTRENGLVVHLNVGFIQDMLNAQLRGKSLEDIRAYLTTREDDCISQAQVADVSELMRKDAMSVYGIHLFGYERRMILAGQAFVTGGYVPEMDNGAAVWAYQKNRNGAGYGRDYNDVNASDTNTESKRKYDGYLRRMQYDGKKGPYSIESIDMLMFYTWHLMENNGWSRTNMRRPTFMVVPIADTGYVVFARRPEPLPPDVPVLSIILGVGVSLLILLLTSMTMIVPIERRIRRIAKVCTQVTGGDYAVRCGDNRNDIIGHLAQDVDDMTASIERHLSQQKSLLQAVSHEIRTPLARIRFTIAMIDVPEDDPKGEERIESIDDDLTEIDNMLKELSYFNYVDAGKGREHFEDNPVQEMIDVALRQRSLQLEPFEVRVEGVTDDMVITADQTAFKRVIGNLLSNASRYAKEKIEVRVCRIQLEKVDMIEVAVEDDGIGIPEEKRETVFEPFVTVDPSRAKSIGGVGLGLAICHRIMRIHRGRIFVDASSLGGARMVTQWPVHQNV